MDTKKVLKSNKKAAQTLFQRCRCIVYSSYKALITIHVTLIAMILFYFLQLSNFFHQDFERSEDLL